jgi:hypothetical protein
MAGLEGQARKLEPRKGKFPKQRTTRLFFDEQGLWRVVSRLEGCFPDVNLTRKPNEAESVFRKRVMEYRSGILNACSS